MTQFLRLSVKNSHATVTVLLNEGNAPVLETTIFFSCHETYALTRSYVTNTSKKEIISKAERYSKLKQKLKNGPENWVKYNELFRNL